MRTGEKLLNLATSHQVLQVIAVSVERGLFDALLGAEVSAAALARRTGSTSAALRRLCTVLEELGLVRTRGDCYHLTNTARRYLCRTSPCSLVPFFLHQASLLEPWSQLEFSLTHNTMAVLPRHRTAGHPQQLRLYLEAMDCHGRLKAPQIFKLIGVRNHRMMLDLGGGIGTYAVAFARRNRKLRAVVVDLADVIRHTKRYIRQHGCSDRVSAIARQCLDESLPPGTFDLVLLSNILHIYAPEDCQRLLHKASDALVQHGTLVVHDYLFGCGDPLAVALCDMTMLVGTPQGRCYRKRDLIAWMRAVGIHRIQTSAVAAGTSVVWGTKK